MAIKNSVVLNTESGFEVPIDNVIVCSTHVKKAIPLHDDKGKFIGVKRVITYDLFNYKNITELRSETENNPNNITGGIKELPSGWEKVMTDAEYIALLSDGSLAEVWLKDYVQSIIGGTSIVFDPYIV